MLYFSRDWRRADISADVIAAAAPDVEHVNLYWSGNPAVLRGWGDARGISRLAKLKTLKVYASPVCLFVPMTLGTILTLYRVAKVPQG